MHWLGRGLNVIKETFRDKTVWIQNINPLISTPVLLRQSLVTGVGTKPAVRPSFCQSAKISEKNLSPPVLVVAQ